jgi:hypothetical protein
MDELELLSQLGLLTPEQRQQTERDARVQGLLSLGSALMQAGQGGGGRRVSTLQGLGMAAPAYMQGQQRAFDETLQGILRRTQLQDLLAKRQEQEAAKRRQAQIQQMIPSLYRERMGQVPTTIPTETYEDVQTTVPGVVGRQLDPERLRMLGMLGPEGMQAATQLAQFERSMTPERKTVTAKPGEQIVDPTTGQVIYQAPFEPTTSYRQLTPQEVKQRGLPADQSFQINEKTGQVSSLTRGPLVQNIMGKAETAFDVEASKAQAKVFSTISEGGQSARRNLREVNSLQSLLNQFSSGGKAAFKEFAGNFGIDTKNLSEIQAATAIINRLVPQQRPPGSGTMSDADLELFKKSLPRIINQPGANEIVLNTLKNIATYQIQESEIADMVLNKEITPAEGRKRMRELVNPIEIYFAGGVIQQYNLEPPKR